MTNQAKIRLLEIACVIVIVTSIAAITVPKLGDLRRRDAARAVLADLEVLREAVYRFHSDSGYFAAESPAHLIPESLASYLPPGFGSRRSYGLISYKNWPGDAARDSVGSSTTAAATRADSAPAQSSTGAVRNASPTVAPAVLVSNVVGATVTNVDPKVLATVGVLAPKTLRFAVGSAYTFLFFGT